MSAKEGNVGRIDRSKQIPNRTKTAENDVIDIGVSEGHLRDGRPYRAELWAQDQVTSITFFIPRTNGEILDDAATVRLLEDEGLVTFGPKRYCGARPFEDDAGQPVWSINMVVGDDEETFLSDSFRFAPYA